jgi:O-antigen ligase
VKLTTSYALLAILVLVWVGREILPNAPEWRRTPLDWPVALFAGATVVTLLGFTGNVADQLIALAKAGGGIALFFLATQSLRERLDMWLVLVAVAATGVIQSLTTIIPVLQGTVEVSEQTRAIGNLADPNLFAGYLVLVGVLAVAMILAVRHRWSLPLAGLITLIFGMALVATLSRSGWIGFLLGLITLAILVRERRLQIALIGGPVIIVLVLVGLADPVAGRLGANEGGPLETFMARVPIWGAAWAMFIHHPIFGVGVNNFIVFAESYGVDFEVNQAHNLFLNIAAERGVLGITTFFLVIAVAFRTLRSAWRKRPDFAGRVLIAGITASLLGFFAHSLFDVSYYDYKILLMFWLVVGIAACSPRLLARPENIDL